MTEDERYQEVIQANIALHTRLSGNYSTCEPHFRPENVANVERKLLAVIRATGAKKLLDLGCGTGFIIHIAKKHVAEVHGVDVTQAMLDKVDRSGPARVTLHTADSGTVAVDEGTFDVATSYSFLHHLYDVGPTMRTAFRALREGGKYYVDLDPNYHFWAAVNALDRHGSYHPIVKREIEQVTYKDEDIEKQFGVSTDVFNKAEHGKTMGGFTEEHLRDKLQAAGFRQVEFFYEWFIGQGSLINDPALPADKRFEYAGQIHALLERAMPLSRNLFKYIGFVATK